MSFSSDVKEELSKLNNLKNKEEVLYELIGYLITINIEERENKIKYSTENENNINRLSKLLNNMKIDYQIKNQGNVYVITFEKNSINEIKKDTIQNITKNEKKENLNKAFVRGSFMGSGSINEPTKNYHVEIVFQNRENALLVANICKIVKINFKELDRKNKYSLYLKDGEEISEFFAFIGASKTVLKFEEIRVIRELRNDINRKVNCETANINKTVSAAVRQIEDIKFLYDRNINLPDNLKEIAELRIENPDCSLVELGKMLKTPLGKSGVNHRLKRIQEIAQDLRKM